MDIGELGWSFCGVDDLLKQISKKLKILDFFTTWCSVTHSRVVLVPGMRIRIFFPLIRIRLSKKKSDPAPDPTLIRNVKTYFYILMKKIFIL